jgi:hypothetical protein
MNEHEENFRGDHRMKEDRFADGFQEGFSRAREIFWRDFMRKAGDARLMGDLLVGTPAEDIDEAKKFALMEVVYRSVADTIAKSHTLYPGAIVVNQDTPEGTETSVNYDTLYNY